MHATTLPGENILPERTQNFFGHFFPKASVCVLSHQGHFGHLWVLLSYYQLIAPLIDRNVKDKSNKCTHTSKTCDKWEIFLLCPYEQATTMFSDSLEQTIFLVIHKRQPKGLWKHQLMIIFRVRLEKPPKQNSSGFVSILIATGRPAGGGSPYRKANPLLLPLAAPILNSSEQRKYPKTPGIFLAQGCNQQVPYTIICL